MLVFVLYLNNLPKRKQIHVYNCKNNHCLMENTVPLESSWSTEPHVHHISTPTQESKPQNITHTGENSHAVRMRIHWPCCWVFSRSHSKVWEKVSQGGSKPMIIAVGLATYSHSAVPRLWHVVALWIPVLRCYKSVKNSFPILMEWITHDNRTWQHKSHCYRWGSRAKSLGIQRGTMGIDSPLRVSWNFLSCLELASWAFGKGR